MATQMSDGSRPEQRAATGPRPRTPVRRLLRTPLFLAAAAVGALL